MVGGVRQSMPAWYHVRCRHPERLPSRYTVHRVLAAGVLHLHSLHTAPAQPPVVEHVEQRAKGSQQSLQIEGQQVSQLCRQDGHHAAVDATSNGGGRPAGMHWLRGSCDAGRQAGWAPKSWFLQLTAARWAEQRRGQPALLSRVSSWAPQRDQVTHRRQKAASKVRGQGEGSRRARHRSIAAAGASFM